MSGLCKGPVPRECPCQSAPGHSPCRSTDVTRPLSRSRSPEAWSSGSVRRTRGRAPLPSSRAGESSASTEHGGRRVPGADRKVDAGRAAPARRGGQSPGAAPARLAAAQASHPQFDVPPANRSASLPPPRRATALGGSPTLGSSRSRCWPALRRALHRRETCSTATPPATRGCKTPWPPCFATPAGWRWARTRCWSPATREDALAGGPDAVPAATPSPSRPWDPPASKAFRAAGLRLVAIPVDDATGRTAGGAARGGRLRAVYLTRTTSTRPR